MSQPASLEGAVAEHLPEVLAAYRGIVRARLCGERLLQRAEQRKSGPFSPARGAEAVAVGAALAMAEGDWVFPAARDVGAALARGASLEQVFLAAGQRVGDPQRGRRFPGHLALNALRLGSSGPNDAGYLAHAAGVAWAAKIRGEERAVLALCDADACEGAGFHDALNFAGVFQLPLIVVVRAGGEDVAGRAVAYGVAGQRCDGSDPVAVGSVVSEARASAAPALVEARISAGLGDADPIVRLERWLGEQGVDCGEERAQMAQAVEAAASRAASQPAVDPAPAQDVYANPPAHLAGMG